MKIKYSLVLLIGSCINSVASLFIATGDGTFLITSSIFLVGYCIVVTIESNENKNQKQ